MADQAVAVGGLKCRCRLKRDVCVSNLPGCCESGNLTNCMVRCLCLPIGTANLISMNQKLILYEQQLLGAKVGGFRASFQIC